MTYQHSNKVREIPANRFESATERYLMIEIAHLADHRGIINQSQTDIATESLLSRVTVAKEFKKLESKGFITREKHGQYKVQIFFGKEEPVKTSSEEVEPLVDDFEDWWDDNALSERSGGEAVLFPMDDIPEEVKQYVAEGQLKPRKGMTLHRGELCIVYDKN